ncbi:hypothetical protein ETI06_13020 [Macrococcoides goetzii]|nr:hypothetical protein [Macrococcus goetzii]TDM45167.1 hypothetical protein ETI06_13020 [Macrococcus goetzii]
MTSSHKFITKVLFDIQQNRVPFDKDIDRLATVLTNLHLNEYIEVVQHDEDEKKAKYQITEKGLAFLMFSLHN